jgi:hypothetical protein
LADIRKAESTTKHNYNMLTRCITMEGSSVIELNPLSVFGHD